MNTPLNVLFLCTGNSCRSIIGEALADHLGKGKLHGLSAGSMPTGKVNENALAVLARHGVPVNTPSSKSMDDLEGEKIDLVITVCDAAAGESCPVWLGDTPKVHWGLEDPAHATGTDDEIRGAFEVTYNELHARVEALAALDFESMNPLGLIATAQKIHREMDNQ
ncbi:MULTISPECIES: arsenate reductase ArsC [unclassified Alcanivorax]|jgi:arsenate reductase|uniref:arsenate reductase ArsC n=1 Tax=Alcanivorax TaxID=59753 RepID=UPI0004ABD9D1|nr:MULTISPECIES: arsenate reductase ArsC [unclassified Alcanivorax]BAP15588.1 arsenate reductase [Alcanivorax sp. NBRC 101098]